MTSSNDWSDLVNNLPIIGQQKTQDLTKRGFFWTFMEAFKVYGGSDEYGSNIERSHGTMGWTMMFLVPIQRENEVLKVYYRSVFEENQNICLDQSLSDPYFMWFCDLDFKTYDVGCNQSMEDPRSEYFKVCALIVKHMRYFYPTLYDSEFKDNDCVEDYQQLENATQEWIGCGQGKSRLRFVMASSGVNQSKTKNPHTKEEKTQQSCGIHLHSIGRLRVTKQQALLMRQYFVCLLTKEFGDRTLEGKNSWDDVFDENVYKGRGGVRVLFSSKVTKCEECVSNKGLNHHQGKKKNFQHNWLRFEDVEDQKEFAAQTNFDSAKTWNGPNHRCNKCKGRGKYITHKAYTPIMVFNAEGQKDQKYQFLTDPKHRYEAILACSIRTAVSEDRSNLWTCPEGYSLEKIHNTSNQEHVKAIETRKKNQIINKEAEIGQGYNNKTEEVKMLLEEIKKFDPLTQKYNHLVANFLKRKSKTTYFLELLRGCPGYNFCVKCQTEHQSNTYFLITPNFIEQKSWSNNQECHDRVHRIPLHVDIRDLLFGKNYDISKASTGKSATNLITGPSNMHLLANTIPRIIFDSQSSPKLFTKTIHNNQKDKNQENVDQDDLHQENLGPSQKNVIFSQEVILEKIVDNCIVDPQSTTNNIQNINYILEEENSQNINCEQPERSDENKQLIHELMFLCNERYKIHFEPQFRQKKIENYKQTSKQTSISSFEPLSGQKKQNQKRSKNQNEINPTKKRSKNKNILGNVAIDQVDELSPHVGVRIIHNEGEDGSKKSKKAKKGTSKKSMDPTPVWLQQAST